MELLHRNAFPANALTKPAASHRIPVSQFDVVSQACLNLLLTAGSRNHSPNKSMPPCDCRKVCVQGTRSARKPRGLALGAKSLLVRPIQATFDFLTMLKLDLLHTSLTTHYNDIRRCTQDAKQTNIRLQSCSKMDVSQCYRHLQLTAQVTLIYRTVLNSPSAMQDLGSILQVLPYSIHSSNPSCLVHPLSATRRLFTTVVAAGRVFPGVKFQSCDFLVGQVNNPLAGLAALLSYIALSCCLRCSAGSCESCAGFYVA